MHNECVPTALHGTLSGGGSTLGVDDSYSPMSLSAVQEMEGESDVVAKQVIRVHASDLHACIHMCVTQRLHACTEMEAVKSLFAPRPSLCSQVLTLPCAS